MNDRMKPEIKALWIEALTSGEYRQGTGTLKTQGGSFCCLGVLCDLAEKAGVVTSEEFQSNSTNYGTAEEFSTDCQESAVLPPSVREWSGLPSNDGLLSSDASLASINDAGESFEAIAQIIEGRF